MVWGAGSNAGGRGVEIEGCMEGGGEKNVLVGRRRMERQRPVKWSCAEGGGAGGAGGAEALDGRR